MENTTSTAAAIRVSLGMDEIVDYICAQSALREFASGDSGYRARILSYANRPELESVVRQAFAACAAYMGDAVTSADAATLSLVVLPPGPVTTSTVAGQLSLAVALAASAVIATAAGESGAEAMRREAAGVLESLREKSYTPSLTQPWR